MLRDILIDNVVNNYLNNLETQLEHQSSETTTARSHSIVTPEIRKAAMKHIKNT